MRALLLSISFLISISIFSQNFGNKEFYLVDSLDFETLHEIDRYHLDSILTLVHDEEVDTIAIRHITDLFYTCENLELRERYSKYVIHYAEKKLGSPFLEQIEYRFYYNLFIEGYMMLAFIEDGRGNVSKAIDFYYLALEMTEFSENKIIQAAIYSDLSSLYYNMANYEKAMELSLLAKSISEGVRDPEGYRIYILSNLAVLYGQTGDYDKALVELMEVLELSKENGSPFEIGVIHFNIGAQYTGGGDYEKAFESYAEAEHIFIEGHHIKWLSLTYSKIATIYLMKEDLANALKYANLALDFAEENGEVMTFLHAYLLKYRVSKAMGNYEEALFFYQKHEQLNDSISGEELKFKALQKEMTYQNEKEKAIALKENEKKWEIAKAEEKQQTLIIFFILGGLILALSFAIFTFSRLRITTRQKAVIEKQNNERKILLKEIHHRVKNNFQIVSSVLKLQAAEEDNEIIYGAFDDAVNRIHSMAAVHEMIYKQEDFSAISPQTYFQKLTQSMQGYFANGEIKFVIDSEIEELNIQSMIPIGIALNELITNSIKYAFDQVKTEPSIGITLNKGEGDYRVLEYKDNGIGISISKKRDSFGMELVETIIEQVEGKMKLITGNEQQGTHLEIHFKELK